jgi:hypothetical protein
MRPFVSLACAVLLTLAGAVSVSAQVVSPPRGSPQRAAVLDAVRPMVEAELGKPVEFVVNEMRLLGEWAFVTLTPQRPGGGKIEYAYTRYQRPVDDDMFGGIVAALLRQTPRGWLVYQYDLGATDVVWLEWKDFYPVPPEVFPGN